MNQVLIALAFLVGLPIIAYLIMKFGTYGYYKGRKISDDDSQEDTKE
jgi:hypothetical protein